MILEAGRPPHLEPDQKIVELARAAGFYRSLLNVESYSEFEAEKFKDTLLDWGYFGPENLRPHWISEFSAPAAKPAR